MQTKIALTTAPSAEKADEIASALVGAGLAACVNIVPGVKSVYFWEGSLQKDEEVLMIIKTSGERRAELEAELMKLHPYSVPEFIVLDTEHTSASYERWLAGILGKGQLPG